MLKQALSFCRYSIGSVSTLAGRDQEDYRDHLMGKGAAMALVTNSWRAQDDAQLTVRKNEHLEIIDDSR